MSEMVTMSREAVQAAWEHLAGWRLDHPHWHTEGLNPLEELFRAALAPAPASRDGGAGVDERDKPTQAELDAVRGYLIDVRSGSHTVGNLRHFANRHEHGDPSDIPEHWVGTPDDAHVTKGMHAHVLWRAFRRAARQAQAPAGAAE